MKKMVMILMMVFTMMAGLFAYEPSRDCFKVSDDMIYYREEVEPLYGGNGVRSFLSTGPIGMKKEAHFLFNGIKFARSLSSFNATAANRTNDEEEKERLINKCSECVHRAVYNIPFVTEKNFWTITEKQYEKKFVKYLNKIQKEELKKQNKNK